MMLKKKDESQREEKKILFHRFVFSNDVVIVAVLRFSRTSVCGSSVVYKLCRYEASQSHNHHLG